ncbi:MAG: HAMP domain-containing histidine kinase, partial [Clostridiales bacterium]|nr:HAMP domain-containing histidine kinase [Clostridiales bacterium]
LGTIIKLHVLFAMACMVCYAIIFNTMKNLESKKKVEQLNADLEQMVEDRTQELHMAYKELESFSYTVIHELKTPIREMDTYLEIIEEDNIEVLADQSKTDIASARNVCTQTLDMIEKMMVYTKAGFVVLDLEKIDMTRLVQDCFDDIQKVNKPKRIVLKLEKLPPIYADAFLIRVAIMNILSNSIKFSQTREVIILSVYVTQYEEQTVYYFTDNGVGFDSDLDNNVLELFTRAHNNSEYEGSGIGLALVKRIINRHGGSVKIQGKEGEGCIVSLIFHNNVK